MAKLKRSMGEESPKPLEVKKRIRSIKKGHEPWKCEVDVHLTKKGGKETFDLKTSLEMNTAKRIIFRNRGRKGFIVKFRLRDEENLGYRFPLDPMAAVWSQAGAECPVTEPGVRTIFWPIAVQDAGMTLVVYNENPEPAIGNFKFNLRVTRDGKKFWELDPGGKDMNGQS